MFNLIVSKKLNIKNCEKDCDNLSRVLSKKTTRKRQRLFLNRARWDNKNKTPHVSIHSYVRPIMGESSGFNRVRSNRDRKRCRIRTPNRARSYPGLNKPAVLYDLRHRPSRVVALFHGQQVVVVASLRERENAAKRDSETMHTFIHIHIHYIHALTLKNLKNLDVVYTCRHCPVSKLRDPLSPSTAATPKNSLERTSAQNVSHEVQIRTPDKTEDARELVALQRATVEKRFACTNETNVRAFRDGATPRDATRREERTVTRRGGMNRVEPGMKREDTPPRSLDVYWANDSERDRFWPTTPSSSTGKSNRVVVDLPTTRSLTFQLSIIIIDW